MNSKIVTFDTFLKIFKDLKSAAVALIAFHRFMMRSAKKAGVDSASVGLRNVLGVRSNRAADLRGPPIWAK